MKVVVVEPRKPAYIKEIENELEPMQEIVGGYIEVVCPFDSCTALICNEEGRGVLPPNRFLRTLPILDDDGNFIGGGEIYDIIAGTFFICGIDGSEFCSLTDEQIEKFLNLYKEIEC